MTTLHETVTTAYVQGDELVLEEFRESDADVVSLVRESDDPEFAVHRCLGMGARVLRLAGATLDTQLVEHRFDEMTGALGRSIEVFAKRVDESAERLLDEESGDLTKALSGWLEEVTSTLDATFDENSRRSAIAKLEKVLESARKEQVRSIRALLDPENDESPLRGWRSEIVSTVDRQGKQIGEAINDLREQLALGDARAEEREKAAGKGFDFEHIVLEQVTEIVRHFEDVPEHTGDVLGSAGSKVGDIVVTVNPTQTPGRVARYVLEAKDKRLSLKNALDELDEAIGNRDAEAGVMVFAAGGNCPVKEPFQWFDHKAIVVLDKTSLNPHALRLACLWARWTSCRETAHDLNAIDIARVKGLLDAAKLSLKTATAIRGSHTKAKTAIDQAGQQLNELTVGLVDTLDELEEALDEAA